MVTETCSLHMCGHMIFAKVLNLPSEERTVSTINNNATYRMRGNICKICIWIRGLYPEYQRNYYNSKTTAGKYWIFSQFSCSFVPNSLWPHGLQHARPPCPSPTLGVYSNSCPLSWWCHPTISSSVIPFSSHLQSFPASGSFPISQFFQSGGQSIGVSASASVLPTNIQDWFPLEWTSWISLQSKGLSRVFFNTTVQKHQFFGAQGSL